ncbi:DUF2946 family protein [Burkholderia sp. Ac-20379]|uniref:DUF2946 family protein n=1 Tax=Burkholderia sp. Ac-20379 TaxID=2703900 RepID=UPI00197CD6D2|nr:DUF2946 family protein [Burkholderia sp. Ac-20379]MBN3726534.1 hypothetical protein [Burkholderia sp. Ac-20379]
MIRLRRLLAQRLTNPAVAALLLLIVAFRLLLPPGLMLATSTGADAAGFAICGGHGALFADAATQGGVSVQAAADLAAALAGSEPSSAHPHGGDLCPFSAALAIGLAATLPPPAYWLRIAGGNRPPRPDHAILQGSSPARGPLGARAPPSSRLA